MDINNKARIHWACRRGMRELDISIMPFFEHEYDTLSDDENVFLSACWSVMTRIYSTG